MTKKKSAKTQSSLPETKTDKPDYAPVSLFRILMAWGYDFLLLVALSIACSALAVVIHVGIYGVPGEHERIHWSLFESILFSCGLCVVLSSYFIYCWRRTGQTLGMKTWRLMVVDAETYGLLSFKQSLVRIAVAIISLACLGLGYWFRWAHPQKRSWHDLASHSQIILLKNN